MTAAANQLKERIWELLEPSLDGYSQLIDRLMSHMTEAQLREVAGIMDNDEEGA